MTDNKQVTHTIEARKSRRSIEVARAPAQRGRHLVAGGLSSRAGGQSTCSCLHHLADSRAFRYLKRIADAGEQREKFVSAIAHLPVLGATLLPPPPPPPSPRLKTATASPNPTGRLTIVVLTCVRGDYPSDQSQPANECGQSGPRRRNKCDQLGSRREQREQRLN